MTNNTISTLVQQYREAAISQVRETKANPREANRLYDVVQSLAGELRNLGAYDELVVLLDDPEASVRLAAASHCLPYAPDKVRATLTQLAEEKDFAIAISAQRALEDMQDGTLS